MSLLSYRDNKVTANWGKVVYKIMNKTANIFCHWEISRETQGSYLTGVFLDT